MTTETQTIQETAAPAAAAPMQQTTVNIAGSPQNNTLLELLSLKTNHLLHSILSFFIAPWAIVWICITSGNCTKRNAIRASNGMAAETNVAKGIGYTLLAIFLLGFIGVAIQ